MEGKEQTRIEILLSICPFKIKQKNNDTKPISKQLKPLPHSFDIKYSCFENAH